MDKKAVQTESDIHDRLIQLLKEEKELNRKKRKEYAIYVCLITAFFILLIISILIETLS